MRIILLGFLLAISASPVQAAELTVSAAISLGEAFREIAADFEVAHPGSRVLLNLGASGALLQQIVRGAPIDVLATADQETLDAAERRGLLDPASRRDIATNSLVLVVPAGAAHSLRALADLRGLSRIAIGNPATVPAGRYARAALEAGGLWNALAAATISAQNVRQVLAYVARGEVDAGFVYATDAALMPGELRVELELPTPVLYPAAAAVEAQPLARDFLEYLLSPAAQAVLSRHGFGPP